MLRAYVRRFGLGFKIRKQSGSVTLTEPGRNQSGVKCLATVPDWSLDHRQDYQKASKARHNYKSDGRLWICKYATFFDSDIYEVAYRNLRKNKATRVDASSFSGITIHRVIEQMKNRSFQFQPLVEIESIDRTRLFTDQLVQEVLRLILEPVFAKSQISAQATLQRVRKWTGTTWLITATTPGLLKNLDHSVLAEILMRAVNDQQLLDLYWKLVNAGLVKTHVRFHNLTGVSKGGILWPLFTNVYLSEFDAWLQDNPLQTLDPVLSKIHYIRYGDQWILGVEGPKSLAVKARDEIRSYLNANLKLQVEDDSVQIFHLASEKVKFLGVLIGTRDRKYVESLVGEKKKKCALGRIVLEAPVNEIVANLVDQGFAVNAEFPRGRSAWIHLEAEEILRRYTNIMRGLMEYYSIVDNKNMMHRVFWMLRFSGIFTLCRKWRISTRALFKKLAHKPQYEDFLKGRITSSTW